MGSNSIGSSGEESSTGLNYRKKSHSIKMVHYFRQISPYSSLKFIFVDNIFRFIIFMARALCGLPCGNHEFTLTVSLFC